MIGKRPLTEYLQHLLETCYRPGTCIELRTGKLTRNGFSYNLCEDVYYNIYAYNFYQNEWVERVFETYHMFDYKNGESRVRVNDDGFKIVMNHDVAKVVVLTDLPETQCDVEIIVNKSPRKNPRSSVPNFNLFSPGVTRYSVDEVALRYTDTYCLKFQKITNLRTMAVSYTVKICIQNRLDNNSSSRVHQVPTPSILVSHLTESALIAAEGQITMDSTAFSDIKSRSAKAVFNLLQDSQYYKVYEMETLYERPA